MRRQMNSTSKAWQQPQLIDNAIDLSAQYISDPIDISGMDNVNVEIVVTTADSEGQFFADVSLTGNVGSYAPLQLKYPALVTAANGAIQMDLNQLSHQFLILRYEPTTPGTGTAVAYWGGKGIGS